MIGFLSGMLWLPEHDVGMVLLTVLKSRVDFNKISKM